MTFWLLNYLACAFNIKNDDPDLDGVFPPKDCNNNDAQVGAPNIDGYVDADGDGYGDATTLQKICAGQSGFVTKAGDCNDNNKDINPTAKEVCDSVDNNCDGKVDDADPAVSDQKTWYVDLDGDGYGDAATSEQSCTQPNGFVDNNGDSDDTNPAVNPDAQEICDGIDNNSDGLIDDADPSTTGQSTWYADSDSDGYGDSSSTIQKCDQPTGYVSDSSDCNDINKKIHPGATETDCSDPTDYNCDGSTGFSDVDGDKTPACEDCNDNDATIYPNAPEICGTTDYDCDGLSGNNDPDSSPASQKTFYKDDDADTYGNSSSTTLACTSPAGYVIDKTDCNDSNKNINPGAQEICDSSNTDEDCDGLVNDSDPSIDPSTQLPWYADTDSDGYGNATSTTQACEQPTGSVTDATDCKDDDNTTYPGATELCDGVDNNCNGMVDDNTTPISWYADTDGDGFGDPNTAVSSCSPIAGYVTNKDDCDDTDSNITGTSSFYADTDGDSYGDASTSQSACTAPTGYVTDKTDCKDTDKNINPGEKEICDASGTDENCDGLADDADPNATGKTTWYGDSDGDTYGTTNTQQDACAQPSGFVANNTDCNDLNKNINPAAQEVCDTSNTDEDCDGLADDLDSSVSSVGKSTWYKDTDGDTYGDSTSTTSACDQPTGYVTDKTDCKDNDKNINPAAQEVCGTVDTDCDGTIGNNDSSASAASKTTWYIDSDGDTYGNSATSQAACTQPVGYVTNSTDCNDNSSSINPAAQEVCGTVDTDCDGTIGNNDSSASAASKTTWYIDSDADTYGNSATSQVACTQPVGYVTDKTDCKDTDKNINPAAKEVCDSNDTDENCNGVADDADGSVSSVGKSTWYKDVDGDNYGDASSSIQKCDQPSGYVTDKTDCKDTDKNINPTAQEVCDASNTDEDCDGLADDLDSSVSSVGKTIWYKDVDGDAYGDAATTSTTCDQPTGFVANATDCDDTSNTIYPGALTDTTYSIDKKWSDCNSSYEPAVAVSASNALFYATGDEATQLLGSGAGIFANFDANGDGYDDLIVGSSTEDTSATNAGGIYALLSGSPTSGNISSTTVSYASSAGISASDFAGKTVINAGNIFGTGQDVLAVSAAYRDPSSLSNAGAIYLLSSLSAGSTNLSSRPGITTNGVVASARFGTAIASSDLNADGTPDLIVTAPYASNGYTYVFNGPVTDTLASTADRTYTGDAATFGETVCAGDITGDGYADMIIGATGSTASSIIYGKAILTASGAQSSVQNVLITGATLSSCLVVDDLGHDGDGYNELALAAKSYSSNNGAVAVFESASLKSGGSNQAYTSASLVFTGGSANDYLGTAVSSSDFDLDGIPDLILGSPTSSGLIYTLWGDSLFSLGTNTLSNDQAGMLRLTGTGAFGTEITAWDFDKDGDDDIIASSPSTTNGAFTSAGTIWGMKNYIQ